MSHSARYLMFLVALLSPATLAMDASSCDQTGFHQDVSIGVIDGVELSINVAFPEVVSEEPRPVLILIHGGGFISGNKDSKNPQIQKLSRLGFVSVSAMYRLSPDFRFPAAIEDVQLAIRYLKANATRYHIDPNRIIVSGSSAGSYLAVMVGVAANSNVFSDHGLYSQFDSSVRAVAAQSAPIGDFRSAKYLNRPTVKRLADPDSDNFEVVLAAMSPVTYLDSSDPPFFLSHGDADPVVPVAMSREFVLELQKLDHPYEYYEVKGGTHDFGSSAPDQAKMVFAAYLDFIKRMGATGDGL